jgi:hypothetical protein
LQPHPAGSPLVGHTQQTAEPAALDGKRGKCDGFAGFNRTERVFGPFFMQLSNTDAAWHKKKPPARRCFAGGFYGFYGNLPYFVPAFCFLFRLCTLIAILS